MKAEQNGPTPGERLAALLATKAIVDEGYGGVLPNGNIVDRRQHPKAIPIPTNRLLGVPAPNPVEGSEAAK